MELKLFKANQGALFAAPWRKPDIGYFIHVAGYASGKTYGDASLVLNLIRRYSRFEVNIGIGGTSFMFLKKTLLVDLFRLLNTWGIPYDFDRQSGIITIDKMQIMCIGVENPDTIYGYNFHAFIDDEIDELPHQKATEAARAIMERTRLKFPDGRDPFRVYSSTSQGYKGLYGIVEDLKEKKVPHVLIRGETRMNTLLPKSYVNDLYRAYTAEQRMAWLEGRFVNLTSGRVYPSYDESKHMMKVPAFAIEPNELVRIGQDLNAGYSRGTATVTRDGVIHVVRIFEFAEIAHAPKMIKEAFPSNIVEWYPDSSGAEIIQGYSAEIRAAGIQTRIGSVNPSVVDRIFFINKLFDMGKLVLWPNCGPLAMALKVRTFDDHGDPEKRQGPTDPSHYADSLEYVAWRIVSRDEAFRFLWDLGRLGRKQITDKLVIA